MSEQALLRKISRSSPQVDDGVLLSRIAAGDLGALGALYDRHQEALFRFAERATGRDASAEDIVQETFLVTIKAATSFDGRSSCRSWLIGIAGRLIMHRARALARLQRMISRLARQPVFHAAGPDEEMAQSESMGALDRALAALSPAKRVVVVMVEIEEMPCEEAARQLGIPVGTVWTRLHHARRELRRTLHFDGDLEVEGQEDT